MAPLIGYRSKSWHVEKLTLKIMELRDTVGPVLPQKMDSTQDNNGARKVGEMGD